MTWASVSTLTTYAAPLDGTANCERPIPSGNICTFAPERHRCDRGLNSTPAVPASAVSSALKGTFPNRAARFDDTINKKLACCMNAFTSEMNGEAADAYAKFDCVDNSKPRAADFNELWASADNEINEGGQMNALYLTNAVGQPITGFFTARGTRCNEFSEFAATEPIQAYKVNPQHKAAQQALVNGDKQAVGVPIPLPPANPYGLLRTKLQKRIPSTGLEYARCPYLVRAALVATCPSNPHSPLVEKSFTDPMGTRCAYAQSIRVHVRVEQIYEIMGEIKMEPVDTILQPTQGNVIHIENILTQKQGGKCEPHTIPRGPVCVYAQ